MSGPRNETELLDEAFTRFLSVEFSRYDNRWNVRLLAGGGDRPDTEIIYADDARDSYVTVNGGYFHAVVYGQPETSRGAVLLTALSVADRGDELIASASSEEEA